MLPMCFPSLNLQYVKSKIISWFWQLNCDNLLKNRDYSDRLRVFWPLKYCCLISDDLYFANKILNDEIPDILTRSVSFNSFFHCIFWGGIRFTHFFLANLKLVLKFVLLPSLPWHCYYFILDFKEIFSCCFSHYFLMMKTDQLCITHNKSNPYLSFQKRNCKNCE